MKLKKGTQKTFETVYPDMQEQFLPEELKDKELLSALLDSQTYDLWLAEETGIPVAYLLTCPYDNYIWLDYIAVFREHQSKGYGSKILPLLSEAYPGAKGLFLEVEHENKEDSNTSRRIWFYRRLGAERILKNYQLPTASGGFPMELYFLPYEKEFPSKAQTLAVIQHVFDTIHADIASRALLLKQIEKEWTE